jgi:YD repeat-containing protein
MQNGAGSETPRTREFAYDSLGRLTAANNPETASNSSPASLSCVPGGPWTTCYTYDLNSNLATKTDNRNVTITYGYDSLSRLISKVYSGQGAGSAIAATTNSSCYQYDISPTAATGGNFIGRLTVAWTQAGMCPLNAPPSGYQTLRSILQYDPMGRAKIEVQCSLKTCTTGPPTVNTSYNLLGERSTYDNGFGTLTITNSYNQANRLSQITSNINDQTHPQQLYNVLDADFSPAGLVNHNMLGINISVIPTYDSRLRTSTLSAVKQ